MDGRIGSRRIARLILCLSALLMASLWQGPALAIELPPPLEDIKDEIEEKIEDIKDEIEDIEDEVEPEVQDIEQEIQESSSQIPLQTQGIGDSENERDAGAQSRSEPRSQQAEDDGDIGAVVGAGHGIGGPGGGGLSFFCTRGEALCYSLPIQQPVVEQPRAGVGLEFTGLNLQRAIAVFFIFAGAGTILLAWDARSRAVLVDGRGSAAG
ncbi:MAG: hypothetical protein ACRDGU_04750 [Actinomycetota bacterium]